MLYEVLEYFISISVGVSFPLSMREKGSKIIQIMLSSLMRSSAKHVLVFLSLCCGYLQNRSRR